MGRKILGIALPALLAVALTGCGLAAQQTASSGPSLETAAASSGAGAPSNDPSAAPSGADAVPNTAEEGSDDLVPANGTVPLAVSEQAAGGVACKQDGDVVLSNDNSTPLVLSYGSGPGLVIAPMSGEDECSMDSYGRELAAKGYHVALISYAGDHPVQLIEDTATWLRSQGSTKIGLLGASKGANLVLAATPAVNPDVTLSLSPPAQFEGVDADAAMAQVKTPVLIVASQNDPTNDADYPVDAKKLVSEAPASAKTQLIIADDSSDHGHAFLDEDEPQRQPILDFLEQHLPAGVN